MRITAATIKDYRRIRSISIKPDADRHLILIAGKNANGKTSLLSALSTAFGGAREIGPDPVRHGAEEAEILIVLDDGALVIDRTIDPDGSTKLVVRDKQGVIRAPQQRLDELIGLRFLDPIRFLQLPAKEQRALLLKLIDKDGSLAALEAKRERCFDQRTDVGREVTRAKGELARLPDAVEVAEPRDVEALSREAAALREVRRKTDHVEHAATLARNKRVEMEASRDRLKADLESIDKSIAELQRKRQEVWDTIGDVSSQEAKMRAAESEAAEMVAEAKRIWEDCEPKLKRIDADLASANEHNQKVFEARAANERRIAAEKTVESHQAGWNELTKTLDLIDRKKLKILAAAKLPVENLNVDASGLILNGAPFESASGAERLRVALGLASAASPGLDDVWIRDGSLLDDESLELVAKHAEMTNKRYWIERVGMSDDGAIVIQDGKVISE